MRIWLVLYCLCYSLLGMSQKRCYVPIQQEILSQSTPDFLLDKNDRETILARQSNVYSRNGALTIPVVFHLIGVSGSNFPSDQLVFSQLDVLNEDFAYLNENRFDTPLEADNLAVDIGLRFCLATVDPDGMPTTGIIRTVSDFDCLGNFSQVQVGDRPRLYYENLGGSDAWDTDRYLNVWVSNTCGVFLGYSTFPGESIPEEDGIIIDPQYFGRSTTGGPIAPYNLGRTLTHEVGHYFNLRHVWGSSGCDDDDLVDDTPNQESFHLGCPLFPSTSCGSPDFFFNFMDFSDDQCLTMFTKGQRDRVWNSIAAFRPTLLRDLGCADLIPNTELAVYPNPARDILYFQFEGEPGLVELNFFDATGRFISNARFENNGARWIDVWDWANGIYFFESVDKVYKGKFVIYR